MTKSIVKVLSAAIVALTLLVMLLFSAFFIALFMLVEVLPR